VSEAEGQASNDPVDQSSGDESTASQRGERVGHAVGEMRAARTWTTWLAAIVAVVFGVVLIAFIAQNTRDVRIELFAISGRLPVAVALLAAALLGAVFVLAIAVVRAALRGLHRRRRRTRAGSDVTAGSDLGGERPRHAEQ